MIHPNRAGSTMTYEAANTLLGHEALAAPVRLATDNPYFTEAFDASNPDQEHFLTTMWEVANHCASDPGDNKERQIVADIFAQFRETIGGSIQHNNGKQTVDFLRFYKQAVAETIRGNNWPEKLNDWRSQGVSFIASTAGRKIIGSQSVERITRALQTVPIIIDDPLTAIAYREANKDQGCVGWFRGSLREAHIDPLAIRTQMALIGKSHPMQAAIAIKNVLFHELIHAGTNQHYIVPYGQAAPGIPTITGPHLWPRDWLESMTQKFADVISAGTATDAERQFVPTDPISLAKIETLHDFDRLWRSTYAPGLPEVLVSEAETGWSNELHYREGRLMIDVFKDKLDWNAAGLSAEAAEQLMAYAFAETPEDTSNYRSQFIAAVGQAAHPGFFMKLYHATEVHGVTLVTDMLMDPHFDPKHALALPFTVTSRYYKDMQHRADVTEKAQGSLSRIEAWDIFDPELDEMRQELRDYVQQYQRAAGNVALLTAALAAERLLLQDTYERPAVAPAQRLVAQLLQEKLPLHKARADAAATEKARRDIETWRQHLPNLIDDKP